MFAQTLRVTFDLLLLRRGPQDLPAAWNLLTILAVLYISANFAQARVSAPSAAALLQALFATGLLAIYVRGLLQFRGVLPRFVQTLSALLAVGLPATLLLIGPTASLVPFLEEMSQGGDTPATQPPMLALLVSAIVSVWALIVFAHIYKHALDTGLGMGVLAALGFEFLLLLVFSLLAGAFI